MWRDRSFPCRASSFVALFHFIALQATANFSKHQFVKDCLAVCGGMTTTGSYVRLEIRLSETDPIEKSKVDLIQQHLNAMERYHRGEGDATPRAPLLISSVLPYERKVSVTHVSLCRRSDFYDILPSKAVVEVQCGFRR